MKILAISDTHGKLNRVRDIFSKLRDIDLIVHAGDHYLDAEALGDEFRIPVVTVKGNCDSGSGAKDYEIIEAECGNILVTHGHRYDVNYSLRNLMYLAEEHDCVAAIFGHTHCALSEEYDDIHFVNPGSLTLPRDGSGGTYAIIRTTEDSFDASIVYYTTVMGSSKKKPQSGFLRGLIQYSDRF